MSDQTNTPASNDASQALADAVIKVYAELNSSDNTATKISNSVVAALTDAFKIVNDAAGVLNEAKTNPADFIQVWTSAAGQIAASFFRK